jgi:D-alanyl-D-alanine carboxypeptidase/D-alanyl-D-alanine-endopeptidase (penicillin-binding protein 4)
LTRRKADPNTDEKNFLEEKMNSFTLKKPLWLSVVFIILLSSAAFSQPAPKPFLQDIKVAEPEPTPLVKRTASTASTATVDVASAGLDAIDIPGYTGILIETLDGKVVKESYSNYAFNPASNVKVATAYAVLKTFGPDYRFPTSVWTDGTIDRFNGVLVGNLYVSGRDPVFTYENGVTIADALNAMGIKQVTGDLIVTDNFTMNYSASVASSANMLMTSMDAAKRNTVAVRAWQNYVVNAKKFGKVSMNPSVTFGGKTYVQPIPTNARLLFSHESPKMREIVKVMMCYSNNFLAERLGDMVGGPYAVARIVQTNAQVSPSEFVLATASGLGINRVTPQAQMKLLRTLRKELEKHNMTFADIMPVAGVDDGTLENRFNSPLGVGSVVGKTGTLGRTDGGVSTLSGEINTRKGKLLFVIFNQRGNVSRFRNFQNNYIAIVQSYFGGGLPMKYDPMTLDARMATTRIAYPQKYNDEE